MNLNYRHLLVRDTFIFKFLNQTTIKNKFSIPTSVFNKVYPDVVLYNKSHVYMSSISYKNFHVLSLELTFNF